MFNIENQYLWKDKIIKSMWYLLFKHALNNDDFKISKTYKKCNIQYVL